MRSQVEADDSALPLLRPQTIVILGCLSADRSPQRALSSLRPRHDFVLLSTCEGQAMEYANQAHSPMCTARAGMSKMHEARSEPNVHLRLYREIAATQDSCQMMLDVQQCTLYRTVERELRACDSMLTTTDTFLSRVEKCPRKPSSCR